MALRFAIRVIKFCSGSKKECRDLQPSWDRLAAEMLEQQVFLAEVSVPGGLTVMFKGKGPNASLPQLLLGGGR